VVSNPAASALGRMLLRYFRHHGIPVINIVRRYVKLNHSEIEISTTKRNAFLIFAGK